MRFASRPHWLLIGVLLATPAGAQPVESEVTTLTQLSSEWMSAIERKDRGALEQILASDFTLQIPGDEQSEIVARDDWVANAIEMDWSGFRYDNVDVTVRGDTAIVTSRLSFKVAPIPIALDSGIVDVWQKRDGRWQVTKRFLGASQVRQRLAFFAGALATLFLGLIAYAIIRLRRRSRPA